MSKLHLSTAALMIASLSGLSTAEGQTRNQPGQSVDQPGQRTTIGDQRSNQSSDSQESQEYRYETRRESYDAQQQGPTVNEALVQKLIKSNEAEIELAKLAQQKTDNQEVEQLTKTMIEDHQSFIQTLQKHASKHESRIGTDRASSSKPSNVRVANDGTSKNDHPSNRQTGNDQLGDHRTADGQSEAQTVVNARTIDSQSNRVPMQLCEIGEQACENALKMTKEMLNQHEGQDFNMAFLGQQCVAHTMLLAELKAIESSGPQELQEIAQQASTKVQQHLDHAKQIAKKLENDSKSLN